MSLLSVILARDTVLPITELLSLIGSWDLDLVSWDLSIGMFPLNAANSCLASTSFSSSSFSDASFPFFLRQEVHFLLCFPSLDSLWRNHWVNKLFVGFRGGFAVISVWKLVIDSPTRPSILSLTRQSSDPSSAFVTQTDLKVDLTSILTSLLELTRSLIISLRSGAGNFLWVVL